MQTISPNTLSSILYYKDIPVSDIPSAIQSLPLTAAWQRQHESMHITRTLPQERRIIAVPYSIPRPWRLPAISRTIIRPLRCMGSRQIMR